MELLVRAERNIKSTMVFLNLFGLILEDKKELTGSDELIIFDSKNEAVGTCVAKNDIVRIEADSSFGKLYASHGIPAFINSNSSQNMGYKTWKSNIKYSIVPKNKANITGEVVIDCLVDDELGPKCTAHLKMRYYQKNKKEIVLVLQEMGNPFDLLIIEKELKESIRISSFKPYISHSIKKGKKDPKTDIYQNDKLTAISDSANGDKLRTRIITQEDGITQSIIEQDYLKPTTDEEAIEQRGLLMKGLDNSMYKRLKGIKKLFTADEIPLLDNFITLCFDNYTDKQQNALLGIEKRPFYQNGHKSLTEAYFGIEKGIELTKNGNISTN